MPRTAVLLFGFLLGAVTADLTRPTKVAQCGTDSECMQHCPVSDEDCDGGPEEVRFFHA